MAQYQDSDLLVSFVDREMCKYYTSMGAGADYFNESGTGKFRVYVEENGLDIDEYELRDDADVNECLLIDFAKDENDSFASFPGLEGDLLEDDRKVMIFNKIKAAVAAVQIPPRGTHAHLLLLLCSPLEVKEWFKTPLEKEQYRREYKSQCHKAFIAANERGLNADIDAMKILCIGRKNGYGYLQHLVDDFLRCKVESVVRNGVANSPLCTLIVDQDRALEAEMKVWIKNYRRKYFKSLQEIHKDVTVQRAMTSFLRVCPTLSVTVSPVYVFDDSLEATVEHIVNAAEFVREMAKQPRNRPFHFDAIIALDHKHKAETVENEDEVDSDDDDEDEEEEDIDESVRDFEEELKANEMRYTISNTDDAKSEELFSSAYAKFSKELRFENARPTNKRFLGLIDRRQRVNAEKLIMFEPPLFTDAEAQRLDRANGRVIPENAVPEWSMNVSMCLICRDAQLDRKVVPTLANIIQNTTNGHFLAVSFQVAADGCIRAYLFVESGCIRFCAEDIVDILPLYFVESEQNNAFVRKQKETQEMIERLKASLIDTAFDKFRHAISV